MFTDAVFVGLEKMDFGSRLQFFDRLKERWCLRCGGDGPDGSCLGCQAWEDANESSWGEPKEPGRGF